MSFISDMKFEHPNVLLFNHEGVFYSLYGIDAFIVNKIFKHAVYPYGGSVKAGFPVNGESIFEELEKLGISYKVVKKDVFIPVIKEFNAEENKYIDYCSQINTDLRNMQIMTFRDIINAPELLQNFNRPKKQSKTAMFKEFIQTLLEGLDPHSGEAVSGLSAATKEYLTSLVK